MSDYFTEADLEAQFAREDRTLVLPENRDPIHARAYDVIVSAQRYRALQILSQHGAVDEGQSVRLAHGGFASVLPGRSLPKAVRAGNDIDSRDLPMLVQDYAMFYVPGGPELHAEKVEHRMREVLAMIAKQILPGMGKRLICKTKEDVHQTLEMSVSRNHLRAKGMGMIHGDEIANMVWLQAETAADYRIERFHEDLMHELALIRMNLEFRYTGKTQWRTDRTIKLVEPTAHLVPETEDDGLRFRFEGQNVWSTPAALDFSLFREGDAARLHLNLGPIQFDGKARVLNTF